MTHWKAPGRSAVSTFVVVREADKALQFAMDVFNAELVREPLRHGDGTVWNAELNIDGCTIMFGEAVNDDMHRPAFIYVMVEDADAVFAKALAHGGTALMEPADQFYGDHDGGVMDPCGNWWWIGTHVEDVPRDELERRAAEVEKKRRGG